MPIPVSCGSCGTKLKAPDSAAGHKTKCPKCSTPILVPGGSTAAPAPAGKAANKTAPAVKATVKAAPAVKAAGKAAAAAPQPAKKAAPAAVQPAKAKPSAPAAKPASAKAETPASDAWASSPLMGEQKWMIRTKERFFFGNFSPPRYDITRMGEKEILGVAVGRPGFFTKILWGMNRNLRQFLTYKFEVHNGEEEHLLCTIRFPTPILNFRPRAEVLDPDGNLLGSFTRKLLAFTVNYELRNPEDEKIGTFSFRMGDFRAGKAPSRVALAPDEGAEWGFVTGETHMEALELAQQAKEGKAKAKVKVQFMAPPPALVIQIDPQAAKRPETKVLLLAGAVVLKAYGYDKMFKV
jgi:hypothetical protein